MNTFKRKNASSAQLKEVQQRQRIVANNAGGVTRSSSFFTNHLSLLLLILCSLLGVQGAWAEELRFDFTSSTKTVTVSGVTVTATLKHDGTDFNFKQQQNVNKKVEISFECSSGYHIKGVYLRDERAGSSNNTSAIQRWVGSSGIITKTAGFVEHDYNGVASTSRTGETTSPYYVVSSSNTTKIAGYTTTSQNYKKFELSFTPPSSVAITIAAAVIVEENNDPLVPIAPSGSDPSWVLTSSNLHGVTFENINDVLTLKQNTLTNDNMLRIYADAEHTVTKSSGGSIQFNTAGVNYVEFKVNTSGYLRIGGNTNDNGAIIYVGEGNSLEDARNHILMQRGNLRNNWRNTITNISVASGETKTIYIWGNKYFHFSQLEWVPDATVSFSLPPSINITKPTSEQPTQTLVPTWEPSSVTNAITWSSSNDAVATVDSDGKVTAKSGGKATITANIGCIAATCEVTVKEQITGYTAENLTVKKGRVVVQKIMYNTAELKGFKHYNSGGTDIVDVISNGKIVGKGTGTASVVAKLEENPIYYGNDISYNVTVENPAVSEGTGYDLFYYFVTEQTRMTTGVTKASGIKLTAKYYADEYVEAPLTINPGDKYITKIEVGWRETGSSPQTADAFAGTLNNCTVENVTGYITTFNVTNTRKPVVIGNGKTWQAWYVKVYYQDTPTEPTVASYVINGDKLDVTISGATHLDYKIKHEDGTITQLGTDDKKYVGESGGTYSISLSDIGTDVIQFQALATGKQSAWTGGIQIVDGRAILEDVDFEATNGSDYWDGGSITNWHGGGTNGNYCAEQYQGSFDISQTLTGLSNGVYEVTAQAFYRPKDYGQGYADYMEDRDLKDAAKVLSYIYANDYAIPVKNIFQEGVESSTALTGYVALGEEGLHYPNDMTSASNSFNRGLYKVTLKVTVTNGTLKVGIFGNRSDKSSRWTCWDNFSVKKISSTDNTASLQTLPGSYKWSYTNGKFGKVGTTYRTADNTSSDNITKSFIVDNGYLELIAGSKQNNYGNINITDGGLAISQVNRDNGYKIKIPSAGKVILRGYTPSQGSDNNEVKIGTADSDKRRLGTELTEIIYDYSGSTAAEVRVWAKGKNNGDTYYLTELVYLQNPGDLITHTSPEGSTFAWTGKRNPKNSSDASWTGYDNNKKKTYTTVINNNGNDASKRDLRIIADEGHSISVSASGYTFSSMGDGDFGYLMFPATVKGTVKIYTNADAVGKKLSVITSSNGIPASNFVAINDVDDPVKDNTDNNYYNLARTIKLFTPDANRMVYISAEPGVTITKIEWIPEYVNGTSADLRPVTEETVWAKDNKFGGYDIPANVNTFIVAPAHTYTNVTGLVGQQGANRMNYGKARTTVNGVTYPTVPNQTLLIYGGDIDHVGDNTDHPTYFTTTGNLMLNNTTNDTERMVEFKVLGKGVVKVISCANGPTARQIDIAAYNHNSTEVLSKVLLSQHSITTGKHDATINSSPTANEQEHLIKYERHQHNSYHAIYAYYDGPEDVEQSIFVYAPGGGISIQEIHWYPGNTIYEVAGGNLSEEGCLKITDANGNENIPDNIYINPREETWVNWDMPTELLKQKEYSFYSTVTTTMEVAAGTKTPVWTTSQAGRKGINDKWIMVNDKVWNDQDQHTGFQVNPTTPTDGKYVAKTGTNNPYTLKVAKRKVFESEASSIQKVGDTEYKNWAEPKKDAESETTEVQQAWGTFYVVAGTYEGNRNDRRRVEVAGPPTEIRVDKLSVTVLAGETATIDVTPITKAYDQDLGWVELKYVADPSAVEWAMCDADGNLVNERNEPYGYQNGDVHQNSIASVANEDDGTYNKVVNLAKHYGERTTVRGISKGKTYVLASIPGVYQYTRNGGTVWVEKTLKQVIEINVIENEIYLTRVMLAPEYINKDENGVGYSNDILDFDVTSPLVYEIEGAYKFTSNDATDNTKFEATFSNNVVTNSNVVVEGTLKRAIDDPAKTYVVFDMVKMLQDGVGEGRQNHYEHINYGAIHEVTLKDITTSYDGTRPTVYVNYYKETGTSGQIVREKQNALYIGDSSNPNVILTFETIHDDSGTEIETFIYNVSQRAETASADVSTTDLKRLISEHIKPSPYTAQYINADGTPNGVTNDTKSWYSNHRSYIRLNNDFSYEAAPSGSLDSHIKTTSNSANISIKPYNTMYGADDKKEAINKVEIYFDMNKLSSANNNSKVTFNVGDTKTERDLAYILDHNGVADWQYTGDDEDPGLGTKTWDFTKPWSEATKNLFKNNNAKDWDGNSNSSESKDTGSSTTNYCKTPTFDTDGNLKAAGSTIDELRGLHFSNLNTKSDGTYSVGLLNGKYLYIAETRCKITIPKVKAGSTLKVDLQTNNSDYARGLSVKVDNKTVLEKTSDKLINLECDIPGNNGYVDVVLQAKGGGIKIYSIEAEVETGSAWIHDMDIDLTDGLYIDQIKVDYYSARRTPKIAYKTFNEFNVETFNKDVNTGISFDGITDDGVPPVTLAFMQNTDTRHFALREDHDRYGELDDYSGFRRGEKIKRNPEKTALVIRDDKTSPCEFYIYSKEHVANIMSIEFVYETDHSTDQNSFTGRDLFCTSDPRFNFEYAHSDNMVGYPLVDMPLGTDDYGSGSGSKNKNKDNEADDISTLRKLVYRPESPVNFASFALNCNQAGFIFVRKIIVRYDNISTSKQYVLSNANRDGQTMGPDKVTDIELATEGIKLSVPKADKEDIAGYLIKRTSLQNNTSQEIILTSSEATHLDINNNKVMLNSAAGSSKFLHQKQYSLRVLDNNRMIVRQLAFRTEKSEVPEIRFFRSSSDTNGNPNQELRTEAPIESDADGNLPTGAKVTIKVEGDGVHNKENIAIIYTTDGSAPSVTFTELNGRVVESINGTAVSGQDGKTFDADELKTLFNTYNGSIVIKAIALPLIEGVTASAAITNNFRNLGYDNEITFGETSEITRANYVRIYPKETFFTTAKRDNDGNFSTTLPVNDPYDIVAQWGEVEDNFNDKFHGAYQPKNASGTIDSKKHPEIFTYGGYEWFKNHDDATMTQTFEFDHSLLHNEYWQVKGNDATPWRGLREIVAGDSYVMSPLEPFNEKGIALFNDSKMKATNDGDFAIKAKTSPSDAEVSTINEHIRYFKGQFDYREHVKMDKTYYRTWNLPCYGDYLRFEPEDNGTLTIYVKQQGVLEQEDGHVDDQLLRYRPVFIFDEAGKTPAGIQAHTTSKVSGDWMTMKHYPNTGSKYLDHDATELFKKVCDTWIKNNTKKNGTTGDEDGDIEYGDRAYETQGLIVLYGDLATAKENTKRPLSNGNTVELQYTGLNRDVLEEYIGPRVGYKNGTENIVAFAEDHNPNGFLLVSEGYVKYELPVKAGKTYFMFASNGNLGFCSYTFKPTEITSEKIINEEITVNDGNDTEMETLLQKKGSAVRKVTLNRTFKNNTWAALVLPFSVSMHQLRKVFGEGVRVSHFNDISEITTADNSIDRITVRHHVHQMVVAGVPVFIRPSFNNNPNDNYDISSVSFENVTIEADQVENVETNIFNVVSPSTGGSRLTQTYSDYICKGSFYNNTVKNLDIYMNAVQGKFAQRVNGDATIKGTRCWITRKSGTGAKLNLTNFAFFGDGLGESDGGDDATYIENIYIGSDDDTNGKVYDLKGQLIRNSADNLEGLPQGVYIINGVKQVIK